MKKIMYTCDRCGKEIEHPEELRAIYTHPNYSEEDHVREESILNDMDFCISDQGEKRNGKNLRV